MNKDVIGWLLQSDPWTSYITRRDLLDEKFTDSERNELISKIKADSRVAAHISDVRDYFPSAATRHTDAKMSHYKLRMLADFGLTAGDGLTDIVGTVKQNQKDGLIAIRQRLPFKDADPEDEWNALPCDNPLIVYTLKSLGDDDPLLSKQLEYLAEKWSAPGGWFCDLPFVINQFKKERKGCPMAGLMALEAFSTDGRYMDSAPARSAFQSIVDHYELKRSIYYFGRGKHFFTFKYPFVWYNALYMADVLSKYEFVKEHPVMLQLIDWIEQSGEDGRYKPTSVFTIYKDWDFGNKKEYSPWITLLCLRILKRFHS